MTYIVETNARELGALTPNARRAKIAHLHRAGVKVNAPLFGRSYGVVVKKGYKPLRPVEYRSPQPPRLQDDPRMHQWQLLGDDDGGLGFSLRPPKWLKKAAGKVAPKKLLSVAKKVGGVAFKFAKANPLLAAGTIVGGVVLKKALAPRRGVTPALQNRIDRTMAILRAKQAGSFVPAPTSATQAPSDTAETPAMTRVARISDTAMVEAGSGEPVMQIDEQSDEPVAEKPVLAPTQAGPAAGLSLLQNAGPLVMAGVGILVLGALARGVRRSR